MSEDTRAGSLVRRASAFWILSLSIAVFCVTVLSSGCAKNRGQDLAALKASIEAVNAQFTEAVSRRDVAAIAQLYAADAQAYPPGLAVVSGRAAIQDMWKGLLSMPVGRLQLRTVEVDGNGETTWETGRFTLVGSNGSTIDEGKYIVIYKHEADGWKLYRDMWSSDSPQQAPAAAPPDTGKPATP
jgi:ketosteroid isomerase-like protein